MTDTYTHLSQQFDGVSKNFSEKTKQLKFTKPPKPQPEKISKQEIENQSNGQTKKSSNKSQNENKDPSKPPTGSKQNSKSQALQEGSQQSKNKSQSQNQESKKQSNEQSQKSKQESKQQSASTPYVSSKLTESEKKPVSNQSQQQSQQVSQRNQSDNMKSVLTMSDDQKSQVSKANTFQRPKSQSRLWSEHTIYTEDQKAKKDQEKKEKDEEKQKWHYKGNLKDKKSFDYFKTTKVSTCSFIQKVGDILLAQPFYKAPQREKEMKLQKESLKANDFKVRPQTCTGASKKPLEPYNPNAARNTLKIPDVKMPHRNKTTFELSDGSDPKLMYKTRNKNIYGNFAQNYHSNNPAIASDLAKRMHFQNEK
ncbi:hypothetical protein ABPG72_012872 [Tetrahymena utriculariae]